MIGVTLKITEIIFESGNKNNESQLSNQVIPFNFYWRPLKRSEIFKLKVCTVNGSQTQIGLVSNPFRLSFLKSTFEC